MRWKVLCSLSQNWHCLLPLQHIICSISRSQLFSLSFCHTYSTTVYHMPHLTRPKCTHAYVRPRMSPELHCVFCLFVYIWMSLGVWSICLRINLPLTVLCSKTSVWNAFLWMSALLTNRWRILWCLWDKGRAGRCVANLNRPTKTCFCGGLVFFTTNFVWLQKLK